jgi:acyl-CoA dehydrogenase
MPFVERMRPIGMAELAFDLLYRRVTSRITFGKPLADRGVIGQWVAEAGCHIEQARLLVLKTAC